MQSTWFDDCLVPNWSCIPPPVFKWVLDPLLNGDIFCASEFFWVVITLVGHLSSDLFLKLNNPISSHSSQICLLFHLVTVNNPHLYLDEPLTYIWILEVNHKLAYCKMNRHMKWLICQVFKKLFSFLHSIVHHFCFHFWWKIITESYWFIYQ